MPGEAKYLIIVNLYTSQGYVETGRFYIGNNKSEACELFSQLQGDNAMVEKILLRLDLVAKRDKELDTIIETRGCTLSEMSENVKVIVKESFRMLNLL